MSEAIAVPLERYRAGARGAMEMWMAGVSRNWRSELTRTVPGGPQQTLEDAAAFMADVGPVEDWPFDHGRIARISVPVLYVLGAESQRFHRMVSRRFQEIVPQTESAVIQGDGHMLHTDQPELVAAELAAFFARHSERR
jgi:pimeloyl-ACP methyl ester carboxylesterase